jgi:hypothetical protein
MSAAKPRFRKLSVAAAAAALLGAAALPLSAAHAYPYFGWDFGNGVGFGIGIPPSAYPGCPNYGYGPNSPYPCAYPHPF